MKVAVISDQHGNLPPIPKCDLLIVSGDITGANPYGYRDESKAIDDYWQKWFYREWMVWRAGIPTVAVAGNHDTCFEFCGPPDIDNFHYLCDSGCQLAGLNFWGVPWVCQWDNLAFNTSDCGMRTVFSYVPHGTNVVVCHMPPLGYGDIPKDITTHHVGSIAITNMVSRVKPRLLTCGHIHEGHGIYDMNGTTVVNAACRFVEVEL